MANDQLFLVPVVAQLQRDVGPVGVLLQQSLTPAEVGLEQDDPPVVEVDDEDAIIGVDRQIQGTVQLLRLPRWTEPMEGLTVRRHLTHSPRPTHPPLVTDDETPRRRLNGMQGVLDVDREMNAANQGGVWTVELQTGRLTAADHQDVSGTPCGRYRPRTRDAAQPTGDSPIGHPHLPDTVLLPVRHVYDAVEVRPGRQVPRSLDLFEFDFLSEGVWIVVFVTSNGVRRLAENVDVVVHLRQTTDDVRWHFQAFQVMQLRRIND